MQNETDTQAELRDLLRKLNPNRPASAFQDTLPRIERVGGSLNLLSTRLRADPYTKALVAGHIGVGKSTELMHLADLLQEDYFVIFRSVSSVLGAHNTSVPTLLVFLLDEAVRRWNAELDDIPKGLTDNISNAFRTPAKGLAQSVSSFQPEPGRNDLRGFATAREMEHFLEKTLQKISLRYLHFQDNRSLDISELAVVFEIFLKEMAEHAGKPLLIVIDDLDKITDDEAALDLFAERAMAWVRLPCAVVATVPVNMYFHERAREVEHIWGEVSILDPLDIPEESLGISDPALLFYLTLMKKIRGDGYFSTTQIQRLARDSGGIVRDFVHLCAFAVNHVLSTGESHLRDWHIDAVERLLTEKFQSRLLDDDYETIDKIVREQGSARAGARLIRDGVLLCKRDRKGQRLFQAHPLAEVLLKNFNFRRSDAKNELIRESSMQENI